MGTRLRRVLHVPDCHSPFHDKIAYGLMLDVGMQFKPDEVVFLGDFFDVYAVSGHRKNPQKDFRTLGEELQPTRDLLIETVNKLKPKKKVFLGGNHEWRVTRYIEDNTPKLSGIYEEREILGIPEDYIYLPYGQKNYYKIGKLTCTHGYLAGENPAATTLKKFHSSVIMGHTHKLQEYHVTNIDGEDFVGICAGWLGDTAKAGEYMNGATNWSQGFVLSWHKDNGSFFYQLIHVNQGQCLFQGEIYRL